MNFRTFSSANDAVLEEGWCQTFTGKKFYPLKPESKDIDIRDIAHGLALTCRFGGQCRAYYSVAQHSILVSKMVPLEWALWGLLHDAAEAYLPDVPRPIKSSLLNFKEIEKEIMIAVLSKFNLPALCMPEVKEADDRMLMTEAMHLFDDVTDWEDFTGPPYEIEIIPWSWQKAEREFLKRYKYLVGK